MKKNKEIHEIQLKVLRLYDELTQFSDQCAFLCDSFAAIPAQQEFIEPETGVDQPLTDILRFPAQ